MNSVRYLIKNAQTALQSELDAEIARAEAAEAAIAADLAAEVTRATGAEASLRSDLNAEISRAEAAEAGLASDIAAEASARAAADTAMTASINSEVSRAQAAEAALTSDLASEISRAEAAEAALASDLATETTNRIAGDADTLAAAKLYADGLTAGLKFKDSVRYAIPTSFTIDGVAITLPAMFSDVVGQTDLVAGDRVLLISPDENTGAVASGIYVVAAGGTSLVRAADMAVGSDASGAYVYVEDGSFTPGSPAKFAGTSYVCMAQKGDDTVGTSALKWAIFSRMENLTFGDGLLKTGQNVTVVLKSTGALKVDDSGLSVKVGDNDHLDTDASGLKLKGALVDGSASNADGEHNHAAVVFMAGFSSAVGSFVKMNGANAGYNGAEILGFVRATFDGESEIVMSGIVEKSASAFAAGDTLYLNQSGDGFVAFGDVPSQKYAIPVGKKIDGTKIFVQIGAPVLKA